MLERSDDQALRAEARARPRELLEVFGDHVGRLEAIDRKLLDGAHDDPLECKRYVRRAAMERNGGIAPDAIGRRPAVGLVAPLEGARSADELVEHDAEREDVAARVHGLAEDLLGGHVRRGSVRRRVVGSIERGRERLLGQGRTPCDPEVEDFHVAAGAGHDVGGLDVAVDDAARVRVRETPRHRRADRGHRVRRHRGSLAQQGRQAEPVDELEHEIEARVGLHERVEQANVGVAELGEHLRLALEMSGER